MGLEFISRVIKTSLVISAFILIFGSVYYDWNYSLGISIGLVFNCVNVWFIMGLVKRTITLEKRKMIPIVGISLIKVPALYFIGYVILKADFVPVTSLLVGFTLLFGVIVLKAVGRLITTSNWMKLANGEKGASQ